MKVRDLAAMLVQWFSVRPGVRDLTVANLKDNAPMELTGFMENIALNPSKPGGPYSWAVDHWRNGLALEVFSSIRYGRIPVPSIEEAELIAWYASDKQRRLMADACLGVNGHNTVVSILRAGQQMELEEIEREARKWLEQRLVSANATMEKTKRFCFS